jgi:hypothetical protein
MWKGRMRSDAFTMRCVIDMMPGKAYFGGRCGPRRISVGFGLAKENSYNGQCTRKP